MTGLLNLYGVAGGSVEPNLEVPVHIDEQCDVMTNPMSGCSCAASTMPQQMLTSRSETGIGCKKQARGTSSQDCLQHGDMTRVSEAPGGIGGGLDTKDVITSNSASNGADDETTGNLFNSINEEFDAPYKTYTGTACKKQARGTSKDCLRHGDNKTRNPEDPGQACKLDMDEGGGIGGGLDTKDIMSNSASNGADDEITSNLVSSINGELDAPYKTYTCIGCKKQARGTSEDCLRHGDNKTRVLEEPGHACNGDMDEGEEIGGGLDTKDITSNSASNLFNSINGEFNAPYKTYTGTACKKQARGMSEDCLRHGDNRTRVSEEPRHACKADMDEGGGNGGGLDTKDIMSNSTSHGADDETTSNLFNSITGDILQCHIMSLLDARSLASCSAVCTRWRDLASADNLWDRFVQEILSKQPLLPLCIMHRDDDASTISRFLVYSIAMVDSQQRELTLGEICGRTWEIRLKPTCGPYWLGFDPTQVGNPGLNRYFHCDGSLSSGPDDPVWGGQESVWKFVRVRGAERVEEDEQAVQINNWPPHRVLRLKDGLWVMENMYALYITVRDNPAFSSSSASRTSDKQITKASCTSCSPPTYGLLPASHKSASRISLTSDK